MEQAIDESLIDMFELISSCRRRTKGSFSPISGRIKNTDEENIYVEIAERDFTYLKRNCKAHYDINFQINDLPYRIQHTALDKVRTFKLHSLLIANKSYEQISNDNNTQAWKRVEF